GDDLQVAVVDLFDFGVLVRRPGLVGGKERLDRRVLTLVAEGEGALHRAAWTATVPSTNQPPWRASATAATWEVTPSFMRMDRICVRTVASETYDALAMVAACWPSTIWRRTSRSRPDSASNGALRRSAARR